MKTLGRLLLLFMLLGSPAAMTGCGDEDDGDKTCTGTKENGAACEVDGECASCLCRALDGPARCVAPPS
jgi:hypothetical protein